MDTLLKLPRWPALPGWPIAVALLAVVIVLAANSGAIGLGLAD